MNQRIDPHARHLATRGILFIVLAAIAYLALVPNDRGQFLPFLPEKIRRWICEHDDFNNVTAFLILGLITFRFRAAPTAARCGRFLPNWALPMAVLMTLVCALEFSQLFIPGRQSQLRDICTGWSGIFAAWLLIAVLGRHRTGDY